MMGLLGAWDYYFDDFSQSSGNDEILGIRGIIWENWDFSMSNDVDD